MIQNRDPGRHTRRQKLAGAEISMRGRPQPVWPPGCPMNMWSMVGRTRERGTWRGPRTPRGLSPEDQDHLRGQAGPLLRGPSPEPPPQPIQPWSWCEQLEAGPRGMAAQGGVSWWVGGEMGGGSTSAHGVEEENHQPLTREHSTKRSQQPILTEHMLGGRWDLPSAAWRPGCALGSDNGDIWAAFLPSPS